LRAESENFCCFVLADQRIIAKSPNPCNTASPATSGPLHGKLHGELHCMAGCMASGNTLPHDL
jgi:hypothetical protein